MKNCLIVSKKEYTGKSVVSDASRHLFVDIIPTLLLLIAMALAMAMVSSKLDSSSVYAEPVVSVETSS